MIGGVRITAIEIRILRGEITALATLEAVALRQHTLCRGLGGHTVASVLEGRSIS